MLSDVSQFLECFVFANLGPSGIGGSSSFSLTYATFLLRCKLDPSEQRGALCGNTWGLPSASVKEENGNKSVNKLCQLNYWGNRSEF